MRATIALVATIVLSGALAGCHAKTRTCKSGTVLVTIDAPSGTDTIAIAVDIDGTAAGTQNVTLTAGTTHGTIEVGFASYPAGHSVDISVTAIGGGMTLGSAETGVHTLAVGCEALTLTIDGTSGGGGDGGSNDDLTGGGCRIAADCPVGQACDAASGACTTACSASQACSGGCCDGAQCVTGTTSTQCALGNALCGSCAGNVAGNACLSNGGASRLCGCTTATDCPANQACNTQTHLCGTSCDVNTPCNGGCCNGTACQPGTADAVCGNTGHACFSCAGNQNGFKCEAVTGGGQCGCAVFPADCPASSSNCTAKLCVNSCSSSTPCQAGCCVITSGTTGTCAPGTTTSACGAVGSTCASCSGNALGSACLSSGMCGCTQKSDCPTGHACDTTLQKCTTTCNTNQPCNGGCCDTTGHCNAGTAVGSCGSSGGTCAVCANNTTCASYSCNGTACVAAYQPSSVYCVDPDPTNCTIGSHCTGSSANCTANHSCLGGYCCDGQGSCGAPPCM